MCLVGSLYVSADCSICSPWFYLFLPMFFLDALLLTAPNVNISLLSSLNILPGSTSASQCLLWLCWVLYMLFVCLLGSPHNLSLVSLVLSIFFLVLLILLGSHQILSVFA